MELYLVASILSILVSTIAFIINAKARNEEIDNLELCKVALLGLILGFSNAYLLQNYISVSNANIPSFGVGEPNF